MTIFDEFRDLAVELAVDFMVPANLVSVSKSYNQATRKSDVTESVVSCRAVMAPRRVMNANGVLTTQTMAVVNRKPNSGDRLDIGGDQYTIGIVEEIAPDGQPIIWMAVANR